jgi:hypothetical protein
MPKLNKIIVYLLILTVPTSAWPDIMRNCSSQQGVQIQMKMADGHVHPSSQSVHHESSGHDKEETTGVTKLECCDECVTMCAAYIGSLATRGAAYSNEYYDSHLRLNITPTEFHTPPPPHSLFRPPISLV